MTPPPIDPAGLLAELRRALDEPRACPILQALHVGCGALALDAIGIDVAPAFVPESEAP